LSAETRPTPSGLRAAYIRKAIEWRPGLLLARFPRGESLPIWWKIGSPS